MSTLKNGIAWNDNLNIGYEHVDAQHRRLFQLVNDLVVACEDGSDKVKLKNTIDFLVNYAVEHFYDEESVQVQWNFPDYLAHKKRHDDFKVTVGEIVDKYNTHGSTKELSDDVNRIVVRWIFSHIQNEDKRIGEFIRKTDSRFV